MGRKDGANRCGQNREYASISSRCFWRPENLIQLSGTDAAIGSNAVVVRNVPAGATAVGIPARIVTGEDAARREAQAAKIGFSAYAISADMNDPIVQAIHSLLDHAASTDGRLQMLIDRLQTEGVDCGDAKATAERFDPTQINKMLE